MHSPASAVIGKVIAAGILLSLSTGLYSQLSAPAQGRSVNPEVGAMSKLWEAPEWKQCLQRFTRSARPAMYPKEQRLVNGECISKERSTAVANGRCFMEAVSPSDLLRATRFEVKLVCMNQTTEVMVCTNKKGHYMDAMTSGMQGNPKCAGFPDLLAVDMRKRGPNKALEHIFRNEKPNTDECGMQVRKIKRLEADPRFDGEKSIRQRWSEEVSVGRRMGCAF